MCYGWQWVQKEGSDEWVWVDYKSYKRLQNEGRITRNKNDFWYPKNLVPAILRTGGDYTLLPMRFDLLPRTFLNQEEYNLLTMEEVIKKKNSRAKNPTTLQPWGFDSYNARAETIRTRFSFKNPWSQGLRCVVPCSSWLERPNEDFTPKEIQGKEYQIIPDKPVFMGAIFDIHSRGTQTLHSLAVVTLTSDDHRIKRDIFHSRLPLILSEGQAEEWVDSKTTPERAYQMILQFPEDRIDIQEYIDPGKVKGGSPKVGKEPSIEQGQLPL